MPAPNDPLLTVRTPAPTDYSTIVRTPAITLHPEQEDDSFDGLEKTPWPKVGEPTKTCKKTCSKKTLFEDQAKRLQSPEDTKGTRLSSSSSTKDDEAFGDGDASSYEDSSEGQEELKIGHDFDPNHCPEDDSFTAAEKAAEGTPEDTPEGEQVVG